MVAKKIYLLRRSVESVCKNTKYVTARGHSVWSQDKIIKSPYKEIVIPKLTLYDYVWENLDRWPERTAAICALTGRGYTFEQAFKLSNNFAASLRKKFKIKDGDAVAVMLPNVPDYPLVVMGILEAGGIVTTINPVYTAHEIQRQLHMSRAKVIVTLPELANTVKESFKLGKLDIPIVVVRTNGQSTPDGTALFSELTEDVNIDKSCLKEVRRSYKDISFLPFSSGTTGLPKAVQLTNRNIVSNCEQFNEEAIRCHRDTTPTYQDSVMAILPMFHIYAATIIMFHKMAHGIKIVTLPKFQPDTFINAMVKYRTNVLFAAPPIILLLTQHPLATPEMFQHLETIINGAAPLASGDIERMCAKAKRKFDVRQGYGLTETSPVICISEKNSENYGSVGLPVPNTNIKIVDGELNALGPNETGELLVKGPQVMKGYMDNPKATAESFTSDGWFRTGDLATVDVTGCVTINDRLKELIKVKGFQVPPAELEGVLREHPGVQDAAVVGVPHATSGEVPKAFIVLRKGTQVDKAEIKDYVAERVAPFKRLDDVMFLDSIPKSAAGKILRKEIKEKFC